MKFRLHTTLLLTLIMTLGFTGCSEESSATDTGEEPSASEGAESSNFSGESILSPEDKDFDDFGQPCSENEDCESGFCVEGSDGFICTQPCLEDCPEGFECKAVDNFYPDIVFLCIPSSNVQCQPCKEDFQCGGGQCASLNEGSFCLEPCAEDVDCNAGMTCATSEANEGTCIPTNGSCSCIEDGIERMCEVENEEGVCAGVQTCSLASGWSLCSAVPASIEVCDYQDNNCDGLVDEGFIINGGYTTAQHCGACNQDCSLVFPNAITTCNGELDTPQCVLVNCEAGYALLGESQCVPASVGLCDPCTTDENCVLDGSVCMEVGDSNYCGTPCQTTADCPGGFSCTTVEAGVPQCYPIGNSCTCTEDTPELVKSCSVTWPGTPVTICYGQQNCGGDGTWEECDLPEEICDNQDNNCDGAVDEGFRDEETGKYLSLNNCGQCGNKCTFNEYENGFAICDESLPVPACGFACVEDYFNVNGNPNDGCECYFSGSTDVPDPLGLDYNCDGIDGEIDNGIFVSKDGNDGADGSLEYPLLTIQAAISRASEEGKRDVYVATGVYQKSIYLYDNVHVYGGYRGDFLERVPTLYETAILGESPSFGTPGAVNGMSTGHQGTATLDGFSIFGGDATLTGESSYAIYLYDAGSGLTLTHNIIYGGNGGNGSSGQNGASGVNGTSGSGGISGANTGGNSCGASDEADGGSGGVQICGGGSTSGGKGGTRICPDAPSSVQTATQTPDGSEYGGAGANNSGGTGAGGNPGWDSLVGFSSCFICSSSNNEQSDGYAGLNGSVGVHGIAAQAANPLNGFATIQGTWSGALSSPGATGTAGGGGGGGGAGAGVDIAASCTSSYAVGGSGGGGGSGGCSGVGGASGGPGGASFGIYANWASSPPDTLPILTNNTIYRGNGGSGGNGGPGGVGGSGGTGGAGGFSGKGTDSFPVVYCGASGGYGGTGGEGGHGGGGAGGAGGLSYGFFVLGLSPTPNDFGSNTYESSGAAGAGGMGGSSFGNSGPIGIDGLAADRNF